MADLNPFSQHSGNSDQLKYQNFGDSPAFTDDDVIAAQQVEPTFSSHGNPNPFAQNLGNLEGRNEDNEPHDHFQHDRNNVSVNTRQRDLDGFEKRLDEREKQLNEQEAELAHRLQHVNNDAGTSPAPNWPFKRCWKVTYHDIIAEIPPKYQRLCRMLYLEWFLGVVLVWFNLVMVLASITSGFEFASSPMLGVLFALLFAFASTILSWRLWYRSIYYAFRDGKTRKWVLFFCWFGIHLCWLFLYFLGIPGTYMVGILTMIDMFAKGSPTLGTMALAEVILAGICFISAMYLIKRVHYSYRNDGISQKLSQEVKRELVQEVVGIETVR